MPDDHLSSGPRSESTARDPSRASNLGDLRVLIADDEATIRQFFIGALEDSVAKMHEAADGIHALEMLLTGNIDIAFLDIRMPGHTGLDILERVQSLGISTQIVIITAGNALENAVEAMTRGSVDFIAKPFSLKQLMSVFRKAVRQRELAEVVEHGEMPPIGKVQPQQLIGASAGMLEVFKTVGRVARRDVPVLITGESGTGKELVARAIHKASDRRDSPFVAVNSAAIPKDLLESELFGHVKGSFTGAINSRPGRFREADGGTLFLDEIGDMPMSLQAKLLRVLQDQNITPVGGTQPEPVNVRVVAATHRDLNAEIEAERFRLDLLYRISVVPISIPPLRERPGDIPVLAQYFARLHGYIVAQTPKYLAKNAIKRLLTHAWPGNVRELENTIIRALVMSNANILDQEDFSFLHKEIAASQTDLEQIIQREVENALSSNDSDIYHTLMNRVEHPIIKAIVNHVNGNQVHAANLLGINRNTLRKKMLEIGMLLPKEE